MADRPSKKSPQVGVRFPQPEMDRLREVADRDYAGNLSTLIKVAVSRLIGDTKTRAESPQNEKAAA